jgi:hypothetical protein
MTKPIEMVDDLLIETNEGALAGQERRVASRGEGSLNTWKRSTQTGCGL